MRVIKILLTVCMAAVAFYGIWNFYRPSKTASLKEQQKNTHAGTTTSKQSWYEKEWLLFAILMLLALSLRLWQFGSVPGGFNQDGAMGAVDAKALADYGTDRFGMKWPVHFTAWGYSQMSVLLSYLMIPFIKILGLTSVAARLPMLLISMGGMAASYFLVRDTLKVRAAQIVLVLMVCNPWHFTQSRWAIDCNVFPHLFIIGLFLLWYGVRKRRILLYGSMFVFALCMYSYGISFYTVPVFLLCLCIYLLRKHLITIKETLLSVFWYLFFSWPIYLTMIINMLGFPSIETPVFTIPFFPDSLRSKDILFFADNKFAQLLQNLRSLINVVFLQKYDLPWNTVGGFGTIFIAFVPIMLLGIWYLLHQMKNTKDTIKRTGYFSILLFFVVGIFAGIITANVNVNRINFIFYSMIILVAAGILFLWEHRRKMVYLVTAVYLWMGCAFLLQYFTDYKETISSAFYEGFLDSLEDIEQADCEVYYITPDSQSSGSQKVSEILTLFAHELDAQYYQGKSNSSNGKYLQPYSVQYQYLNASQHLPDPKENAAYVISNDDLDLFSEDEYWITIHNQYSSAIPKTALVLE